MFVRELSLEGDLLGDVRELMGVHNNRKIDLAAKGSKFVVATTDSIYFSSENNNVTLFVEKNRFGNDPDVALLSDGFVVCHADNPKQFCALYSVLTLSDTISSTSMTELAPTPELSVFLTITFVGVFASVLVVLSMICFCIFRRRKHTADCSLENRPNPVAERSRSPSRSYLRHRSSSKSEDNPRSRSSSRSRRIHSRANMSMKSLSSVDASLMKTKVQTLGTSDLVIAGSTVGTTQLAAAQNYGTVNMVQPAAVPDYNQLQLKPHEYDPTVSVGARDARYVIGPAEIEREKLLGAGNFGEVWKCDWKGVPVAVKVVKGVDAGARKQLELEASRFQALPNHPNVITFYGLVLEPLSVVLEFAPGGALESALYGSKPRSFTDQQSIEIVRGVALGVAHLHDHNIIHRDLAARNVLLGHGDVPKITDFGMSRESMMDKQHTMTRLGPIKWMAPEQMTDQVVSPESDIYSFGVVIFEVFAKQEPWTGNSNIQVAQKVCQGDCLPVPEGAPLVIAETMRSCFQFDSKLRPTARSIAQKLSSAIKRRTTISTLADVSGSQPPGYLAPPQMKSTNEQHSSSLSYDLPPPDIMRKHGHLRS